MRPTEAFVHLVPTSLWSSDDRVVWWWLGEGRTLSLLLERRLGVEHAQRPNELVEIHDVVLLQVKENEELRQGRNTWAFWPRGMT